MPFFREIKSQLRAWLQNADWSEQKPLPDELSALADLAPKKLLSPLIACLPEENISARAAYAFGWVLNKLFAVDPGAARETMRRLLWQMNEESGNLAWGVPLAFGQSLAQNRVLADEYHRILFHYIYDKEGDSTYCDFAPLRRACYQAVDMVLKANPDLAEAALPLLRDAAERDEDRACREQAEQSCALAGQILSERQ